jgi:hypothetical protein
MYHKLSRKPADSGNASGRHAANVQIMAKDHDTQMSGHLNDIWSAFTIITIPMLAFSAALLGLVYSIVSPTGSRRTTDFGHLIPPMNLGSTM